VREGGDAGGKRDPTQRLGHSTHEGAPAELAAHDIGEARGLFAAGPVEEGDELLSPVAGRDVAPAAGALEDLRHGMENLVGLLVAISVVVVLEMVEVEEDEGDRVPGGARALDLELQALAEEPHVVEAGQGIGDGPAVRTRHPGGEVANALELEPEELFEHVGPRADEVAEASRGYAQDTRGGPGAHSGRPGLSVECGQLADDRAGVHRPEHQALALRGLVGDLQSPVEEEDHVVARVALAPEEGTPGERKLFSEGAQVSREPVAHE
jgi:hypothetical protein